MVIHQDTTICPEDNAGTLQWTSGQVEEYFRRRKYVDRRSHHVKKEVRDNNIVLRNVSMCETIVDLLTKPLKISGILNALKKIKDVHHDSVVF